MLSIWSYNGRCVSAWCYRIRMKTTMSVRSSNSPLFFWTPTGTFRDTTMLTTRTWPLCSCSARLCFFITYHHSNATEARLYLWTSRNIFCVTLLWPTLLSIRTMASEIKAELLKIPPVTRFLCASQLAVSLPVMLQILSPYQVVFVWQFVIQRFEVSPHNEIIDFHVYWTSPLDLEAVY